MLKAFLNLSRNRLVVVVWGGVFGYKQAKYAISCMLVCVVNTRNNLIKCTELDYYI